MPRKSLDAPEDLPKQALRQVAFGELGDEVPRMFFTARSRVHLT